MSKFVDKSFPTRGTWIEIAVASNFFSFMVVSFPTRGTWIEIKRIVVACRAGSVVPHTGNVD